MSEQIKNKLYNYEVSPPPGAWQSIYQELQGHDQFSLVSKKMSSYEVAPPAASWQSILQDLNNLPAEPQVIPVKNTNKRVYTMMAAAAVLGVVLLGSYYIITNLTSRLQISSNQVKKTGITQKKQQGPASVFKDSGLSDPMAVQRLNTSISSHPIYRSLKGNNKKSNRILHNSVIKDDQTSEAALSYSIVPKPIRNEKGFIIQNPNLMNTGKENYISVTGPNGQQTKISAKFINVLLYMNGDNNIEQFEGYFSKTFMESLVWKSRFQEWRNKILQTSLIPSSDNFMDILELKDLIVKDELNK